MKNFGSERIVPALHNLPLTVLGAGMVSVVLAGFAGSKLPLAPTGAGIQQSELLEDLGLVRDELIVSEVTSLPTADLIVAAEEMVSAGQLFEPALMGGASIDTSQTKMGVSVAGGIGSLGPWSPPKRMSRGSVVNNGSNSARRARSARHSFPRFGMPSIGRRAGAPALTQSITTNEYLPVELPKAIVDEPSVLDPGTSGVTLASDKDESKETGDFPQDLTTDVLPIVGSEPVEEWLDEGGQVSGDNPDVRELFEIQANQDPGAEQAEGSGEVVELAQVSAPSSLLLAGIGLLATGGFRRTQSRKA